MIWIDLRKKVFSPLQRHFTNICIQLICKHPKFYFCIESDAPCFFFDRLPAVGPLRSKSCVDTHEK